MIEPTDEERLKYLSADLGNCKKLWKKYRRWIIDDSGYVDPVKLMEKLILAPHQDRPYLYSLGYWNHGRKNGFYDPREEVEAPRKKIF